MTNSNPSSLAASTQEIKIYEKTYRLPVLNSTNFSRLQQQIKARQQIIKSDKRFIQREIESKGGFFGLGKRKEIIREAKPITFEEKFKELEILITDYNKIINFLTQHKDAYQDFFLQLTDELKSIVNQKCQELDRVEKRRLEGLADAEDDPILLDLYRNQQQQIFRIAFVLYRATQLMLKKVDLINKSIQKLADDQVEQRQLLEKMVGRLGKYQNAYAVQQNINQLEQDVKRLADVAVNFESLMSDFLGPFQGLIDQVVSIDQELSGTVEEIRILAGDILTQDVRLFAFDESESISNSIIDFLVKSNTDNFPCEDLRTIDQLWVQYSQGRFGFSVQKNIWLEVGGKVDYDTEEKLSDRVGWRKREEWIVSYDSLQFNLSAPPGHLPVFVFGVFSGWVGWRFSSLAQRTVSCKI